MGYSEALEATGATVKEYKEFGSYQGTWIAILEDGRFVEGSYGSCSGCDSFQGEFSYDDKIEEYEGKYYRNNNHWDEDEEISREMADELNARYNERLKNFGQGYINGAETKEEIIKRYEEKCKDEYAWEDDKEILEWLKTI
jgi:hypothetical protein